MRVHCGARREICRPLTDKAKQGARRLIVEAPGIVSSADRQFWLASQQTTLSPFDRYGLRRIDGVATHF